MRFRTTKRFWAAYESLSEEIRQRAREAYLQFSRDPSHPGLKFKCVHASKAIYSVRVTKGFRAIGILDGDTVTWIWIGSHAEYERLLAKA